MDPIRDFISHEHRDFSVKFGKRVASSLSGFVAGAVVATIIWGLGFYLSTALR